MAENNLERKKKEIKERFDFNKFEDYIKFPKYFEFETVNACNARCKMCTVTQWDGYNQKDKYKRVVSDELWNKFVKNVQPYSKWIEKITLTRDGETLLDSKIANRITELKKAGIKQVVIVTNASLLSQKKSIELLNSGLDEIMISIDGFTKHTYESIRIGLKYEKVLQNTLNFIKIREKLNANTTIRIRLIEQKENMKEIDNFIKFWKNNTRSSDQVYSMPLHSWGNQLIKENEEKVKEWGKKACISPFSSMAIHFDGRVGMCGVDFNCKYKTGDLNLNSIEEIWRGEIFSTIRSNHLNSNRNAYELCKGCNLWDRVYKK
ncbi:molybdenum cofactor biosynthesis protein MoaB [Campylobacter fetus subsp. testudinum]|uniref:radical SAM/SPASM domain-containing protein n=1 Tax=Campylobacter fetus TaxID=196 RepID=UPI00057D7CC3|nr:radical SAM/SPASM domain-containing protein [Campylobacter fetus]AJB46118.1 molybdenum cofactor biosynthesis protein MoaB [Campylobacter fetus subsp. testudinum]